MRSFVFRALNSELNLEVKGGLVQIHEAMLKSGIILITGVLIGAGMMTIIQLNECDEKVSSGAEVVTSQDVEVSLDPISATVIDANIDMDQVYDTLVNEPEQSDEPWFEEELEKINALNNDILDQLNADADEVEKLFQQASGLK